MKLHKILSRALQRFSNDQQGIAFIELAFAIPILLILFFGVVSISDFVRTIQRSESTVINMTDVVSQLPVTATTLDMASLTNAIPLMMGFAYRSDTQMTVIFTDVQRKNTKEQLVWQYTYNSPSTVTPYTSALGIPSTGQCKDITGNPAVTFMNSTGSEGDETVFGEIYYRYNPIYTYVLGKNNEVKRTVAGPVTISRQIFFLPRYTNLQNIAFNTTKCTLQ